MERKIHSHKGPSERIYKEANEKLGFFLQGQETVSRVLIYLAVSRQVARSSLAAFGVFSEEVDGLRLATTERNFGLVQEIFHTFAVSMFISHELIPPLDYCIFILLFLDRGVKGF